MLLTSYWVSIFPEMRQRIINKRGAWDPSHISFRGERMKGWRYIHDGRIRQFALCQSSLRCRGPQPKKINQHSLDYGPFYLPRVDKICMRRNPPPPLCFTRLPRPRANYPLISFITTKFNFQDTRDSLRLILNLITFKDTQQQNQKSIDIIANLIWSNV